MSVFLKQPIHDAQIAAASILLTSDQCPPRHSTSPMGPERLPASHSSTISWDLQPANVKQPTGADLAVETRSPPPEHGAPRLSHKPDHRRRVKAGY